MNLRGRLKTENMIIRRKKSMTLVVVKKMQLRKVKLRMASLNCNVQYILVINFNFYAIGCNYINYIKCHKVLGKLYITNDTYTRYLILSKQKY